MIVLIGPTAVGKTELSLTIAEDFGCEIISMDSMQIYKHMDIGTAKPSKEEQERAPHHLIDFVDPAEQYNVARYVADAEASMQKVAQANHLPLFVGGTGLYMKGVLEGIFELPAVSGETKKRVQYILQDKGLPFLHAELSKVDPESASRVHPNDLQRTTRAMEIFIETGIPWSQHLHMHNKEKSKCKERYDVVKIGLNYDRKLLYERINRRVDIMVDQGLLREVEGLLSMGYSRDLNAMQAIGYKHMIEFIDKKWQWEKALEYLARDTRRYAKRQLTWFGRDPEIKWFRPDKPKEVVLLLKEFLGQ
ncbi:MAG: tRNA (adenosine(37)-N6)-dimethylallyltransferase MiaA [Desulfobulbaceae bacterium]|nr:tRNA (adenosine(37)-N6)-dimethylallyltransferase MiaA [Desulfobulbaceae bacterium]